MSEFWHSTGAARDASPGRRHPRKKWIYPSTPGRPPVPPEVRALVKQPAWNRRHDSHRHSRSGLSSYNDIGAVEWPWAGIANADADADADNRGSAAPATHPLPRQMSAVSHRQAAASAAQG